MKFIEINNSYIHSNSNLGKNTNILPFSYIYDDVEIGDNCSIGPNVTIMSGARIGNGCKIYPGAVISAEPQDIKYKGEKTYTYIGNNTTIRECVTINRGTGISGFTKIGNNCLIMASSHVAHDCRVEDNVIIVNGVGIAGHVEIGKNAFIGGMSAIHQFSKIGEYAFIAGCSEIRKDIPPYVKAGRNPISYIGVNIVGLHRAGFSLSSIEKIKYIYKHIYESGKNVSQAIKLITNNVNIMKDKYVENILSFIDKSSRGIMKGYNFKYKN